MQTRFTLKDRTYARLYDKVNFTISVDLQDNEAMVDLDKVLIPGKSYEVNVKELGKKRSSSANGFAWVLIGKLAEALPLGTTEVYRQVIQEMYTYRVDRIKEQDFEQERTEWMKDHIGRDLVKTGKAFRDENGDIWLECLKYRSSSDYSTSEMSKFIDLLLFECESQGIDPEKSKKEIDQLKADWK